MFLAIVQTVGTVAALATVGVTVFELRAARAERAEQRAFQQLDRYERSLERLGRLALKVEAIRINLDTAGFAMLGVEFLRTPLRELDLEILGSPDRQQITACAALASADADESPERLRALIDDAALEIGAVRNERATAVEQLTGAYTAARRLARV